MVKKRCNFCRKYLRPDGTCQNPSCPRYVPEPQPEPTEGQAEEETKAE
jgi:hypothetical protein